LPDSLVLIARCNSLLEAQLLRAKLAAAQIEAHLPDERGASVLGEHFTAVGGIRVFVLRSQAEPALELLGMDAPAGGPREDALGEPSRDEPDRCPICRTAQPPRPAPSRSGLLKLLRAFARGGAAASLTCRVCGYRP
jgi:hypothetical protein